MEPTAPDSSRSVDYFPYDGKDPRTVEGLNVKTCVNCKLTFGDLGIGRCPSCNSHMIKDA